MSLLIKNAVLADHRGCKKADIFIRDGIINKIGENLDYDCETLDAAGLYALPAFTDLHVHLRDPGLTHKEDIETGTLAATKGGYTTVIAMANTKPVCSDLATARYVAEKAASFGYCDVYQCLSLTEGFQNETVKHLDCLADDPGKRIVKFASEDGFGVKSSFMFYEALKKCAGYGRPVLVHAEDAAFSKTDMYAAEDLETIRDLYICERTPGARVHFCHVSTAYSAEKIIEAKKRGVNVSFEVTPHHIALNDETPYRVNPPMRSENDRKYLIRAIREGHVLAIATDHAPHTAEDKINGSPGLVGLETAFSVCYTVLVRQEGIPLETLSALMSKNPSEFAGINKGELSEGYIADIVLANLEKNVTIDPKKFKSKGRNTPFAEKSYYGEIVRTIKDGVIII